MTRGQTIKIAGRSFHVWHQFDDPDRFVQIDEVNADGENISDENMPSMGKSMADARRLIAEFIYLGG